jgi:hypothetical protein
MDRELFAFCERLIALARQQQDRAPRGEAVACYASYGEDGNLFIPPDGNGHFPLYGAAAIHQLEEENATLRKGLNAARNGHSILAALDRMLTAERKLAELAAPSASIDAAQPAQSIPQEGQP